MWMSTKKQRGTQYIIIYQWVGYVEAPAEVDFEGPHHSGWQHETMAHERTWRGIWWYSPSYLANLFFLKKK